MSAKRSKRIKDKEFISKTGVAVTRNYCRKCMKDKRPTDFYTATDKTLDTNGLMSVCKSCILEMYDSYYLIERTLDKTILMMCKILNIVFDTAVVDSVRNQLNNAQSSDRKPPKPFSLYMMRLGAMYARGKTMESPSEHDMTFNFNSVSEEDIQEMNSELSAPNEFWGDNYTLDELDFLEKEYAKFKQSYSPDTYADILLLKRVCKKILAIQNEEEVSGKNVGNLEKQLMALMKDLAISPAHANAASGGKSLDTFGIWIADIEKKNPAQWLEEDGKDLHFDVDNVHEYYDKYVTRPIRNYLTGTSNFEIDGDTEYGDLFSDSSDKNE